MIILPRKLGKKGTLEAFFFKNGFGKTIFKEECLQKNLLRDAEGGEQAKILGALYFQDYPTSLSIRLIEKKDSSQDEIKKNQCSSPNIWLIKRRLNNKKHWTRLLKLIKTL